MKRRMDSLIQSLVLVRLGQELGYESTLAVSLASVIDFLIQMLSRFF
jgi:hypothetical protein